MKILHIVSGSSAGGAALGARAIHDELHKLGYDSTIVFDTLVTPNPGYIQINLFSKVKLIANKVLEKLYSFLNPHHLDLFSNTFGLSVHSSVIKSEKPDIVHLHWISRSGKLGQYKGKFKTVVTARDMWWATGGCHYSLECQNYKSNCENCKMFTSAKNLKHQKARKKNFLHGSEIVTISNWLTEVFRSSGITQCTWINNSVIQNLQIADDSRLKKTRPFVFLPMGNLNVKYKSLESVATIIEGNQEYDFVLAGPGRIPDSFTDLSNVRHIGFLDREELNWYYSNADFTMVTSKQEAFGKTVVEALSFGSYVLAYKNTAPHEIIEHCIVSPTTHVFLDDILGQTKSLSTINTGEHKINWKNLRGYLPENIAEKYLEIYKKCN